MDDTTAKAPGEIYGRLLWLVFGALSWKYALNIEQLGLPRDSAAAIALYVTGYGLGICAMVMSVSSRASFAFRGRAAFAFFAFFVVSYSVADALVRARTPYGWLTDAHAFMDNAARILIRGRNPYAESLYGAYSLHHLPSDLQTPLRDGGLSDKLAYPSLSFLVLVPFVALHVDSRFVYAAALIGCVGILYFRTPKALRAIVLLPFVANPDFLGFALGGVTDSIWALFLCAVVATWGRKWAPALFFGLACACKQHAWLIAPFILVRLWHECPREERRRTVARFFGVTAAVAIAFNLPFVLWGPADWVGGIVESLLRDMVPFGGGPSAFVFQSGLSLPKWAFAVAFWGVYVALIAVIARERRYKNLIWIAPSIAFFFNYRSLSSYWFFNFFPFAIDLVSNPPKELPSLPFPRRRVLAFAAAACALIVFGIAFGRAHADDLGMVIQNPIRTMDERAIRLDVKLTNNTGRTVSPRFWVQGLNFQPLPWRIDKGPHELPPGAADVFSISALHRSSEFDAISGARVTVTDIGSDARSTVVIRADKSQRAPDAIPNPTFRYWDLANGVPTFWFVTEDGSPGAFAAVNDDHAGIVLSLDPDEQTAEARRHQFCTILPTCFAAATAGPRTRQGDATAQDHVIQVSLEGAFYRGRVRISAFPPPDSNRAPAFDERYGVMLYIGSERVFALLGGEPGEGRLAEGSRYVVIPGTRGAWSTFELDLGALKDKFAPNVYPGALRQDRLPLLNVPAIRFRISLTYAARGKTRGQAMFGPIEDDGVPDNADPERVMQELEANRGQVDAYRAEYEMSLRNVSRGKDYMTRASRSENHPTLALRSAQFALQNGDTSVAIERFTSLLPISPLEGHLGLGWAELGQKHFAPARTHFEAALKVLSDGQNARREITGDEELQRLNGTVGVAITLAAENECSKAMATLADVPADDLRPVLIIPEIAACNADGGAGDAGPG